MPSGTNGAGVGQGWTLYSNKCAAKDFPICERILDEVRTNQKRPIDYHKVWKHYADRRADAPFISSTKRQYKPRKICLLGCCIQGPRSALDSELLKLSMNLMKNLARLCKNQRKESKGYSAALKGSCYSNVLPGFDYLALISIRYAMCLCWMHTLMPYSLPQLAFTSVTKCPHSVRLTSHIGLMNS